MQERENILRILKETKQAVKQEDSNWLRELSNQTIHTASISQDADNIATAVIVYSLSKIVERKDYRQYKDWNSFFKKLMLCIERAVQALEKKQDDYFRDQVACVRKEIDSLSGKLKRNIQDVFEKARISKASRIYEHGISMEQTAKLLGITIWELAEYAGETGISDVNLNITIPEKQRIKNILEFFK